MTPGGLLFCDNKEAVENSIVFELFLYLSV